MEERRNKHRSVCTRIDSEDDGHDEVEIETKRNWERTVFWRTLEPWPKALRVLSYVIILDNVVLLLVPVSYRPVLGSKICGF